MLRQKTADEVRVQVEIEVRAAVIALAAARKAFGAASGRMILTAPVVPTTRFWQIVDEYRRCLGKSLDSQMGTKDASDELARTAWAGSGIFSPDSLPEFAAFVREYARTSVWLEAALDEQGHLRCQMTDDAFADFCDALPVAGSVVHDKVLGGKYPSLAAIEEDVRAAVGPLTTSVMEGENMHAKHLTGALNFFLLAAYCPDDIGLEELASYSDADEWNS